MFLIKTIHICVVNSSEMFLETLKQICRSKILRFKITTQKEVANAVGDYIILFNTREFYPCKQATIAVCDNTSHIDPAGFFDIWLINNISMRIKNFVQYCEQKCTADFHKLILQTTIDTSEDLIWIKDIEGYHRLVNDAFCKAVNKYESDVIGKDHYDVWDVDKPASDGDDFVCVTSETEVITKGIYCVFDEDVCIRDEIHKFMTGKSPIYNLDGDIVATVGVGKDITGDQMNKQLLYRIAMVDGLTDVYNRNYIDKVVIPSNHVNALAFIDINNFKSINDTLGHDDGDKALKLVATSLSRLLPNYIVARWGGDEFVVLCINDTKYNIFKINVLNALATIDLTLQNHFMGLSVSLSIGIVENLNFSFDELLEKADTEMYVMKKELGVERR